MIRRNNREIIILEGSRGKNFIVCKCHAHKIDKHKWHILKGGYVARSVWDVGMGKNKEMIYVHRVIVDAPKGKVVDHINQDPLYNTCWNLRIVGQVDNLRNTGMWKHNTSGNKGVAWHKQAGKWRAFITVNQKQIALGLFDDKAEAVKARLEAEKEYFGRM